MYGDNGDKRASKIEYKTCATLPERENLILRKLCDIWTNERTELSFLYIFCYPMRIDMHICV